MSLDSTASKKGVKFSDTESPASSPKSAEPPKVDLSAAAEKKPDAAGATQSPRQRGNSQSPVVSQAEINTSVLRKGKPKKQLAEKANEKDRLRTVKIGQRTMGWLQRYVALPALEILIWMISNIFFREVQVVGEENIPKEGAVVFYANHQNQFIDAIMLRSLCKRQCRFIIAEKSMHRPVVGQFARLMNSVPVVRPQDVPHEQGKGKLNLTLNPEDDQKNIVRGDGTDFTDLKQGDVVIWAHPTTGKKCQAQVFKIDSANKFQATTPIAESERPADGALISYKFSRRIDQSEMYAEVYSTLDEGHTIGIFPEGGSHDRTSLQPLKAGVALFTLGAAERGIHTKIVPVGLTYFHGHRFRSKVTVQFGEPISPDEELVEKFGNDKRQATSEFLDILNAALKSVTINVCDWPTLKFLHAFRRLYQPQDVILDTRNHLSLTRRLSILIKELEDDAEFSEFRGKVESHMDYCAALLIRDSQAATLGRLKDSGISWALLVRRVVVICVMGFILLPYMFIASPIGIVAQMLSEDHSKTALAASTVKVAGQDVKASYKIITCIGLIPLVISIISTTIFFFTDLRTAATVWCSLPMMMYVSLLISQEFVLELRATLPLIISMLSKHKQFVKVYNGREKLVAWANDIVNKHDPKLAKELEELDHIENYSVNKTPSLFSLRHSHATTNNHSSRKKKA